MKSIRITAADIAQHAADADVRCAATCRLTDQPPSGLRQRHSQIRQKAQAMRLALFLLGIIGCCTHCLGPARAAEVEVTPALVCTVAHALKQPWPVDRCQAVAAALATTREPKTMLAVAVLESDMRPHAVAWHGRHVADVGLMGIRCRLGARRTCQNGPARGLTPAQLTNPVTSVMVAEDIMAWKRARVGNRRALAAYAGDADGRSGRAGDVRALVAAFAGVELQVKKARVRELVRKIAAAVRRGARS